MISLTHQRRKTSPIRLSNCDGPNNLSTNHKRFDRLSSTLVNYSDKNFSTKSHRKNLQQGFSTLSRHNTNSGGGDSGYSEDSFATTTISSHTRPLHTSCPHCHCEQRSSFNNYKNQIPNSSTDSSTSKNITNSFIKLRWSK